MYTLRIFRFFTPPLARQPRVDLNEKKEEIFVKIFLIARVKYSILQVVGIYERWLLEEEKLWMKRACDFWAKSGIAASAAEDSEFSLTWYEIVEIIGS